MGASLSSDIYQYKVDSHLEVIEQCVAIADDIIIYGYDIDGTILFFARSLVATTGQTNTMNATFKIVHSALLHNGVISNINVGYHTV